MSDKTPTAVEAHLMKRAGAVTADIGDVLGIDAFTPNTIEAMARVIADAMMSEAELALSRAALAGESVEPVADRCDVCGEVPIAGAVCKRFDCPALVASPPDTALAEARAEIERMEKALRLGVEYDDLLRKYEGQAQVLFAGDMKEIDAAYDRWVDASRAALRARSEPKP